MVLKTGDVLLFSEQPSSCCMYSFDSLIKCCTCSKYSHAALVVVDPPWAPELKGTFVWESSWHGVPDPQDYIVKFGVQLTPLEFYTHQYPGSVRIFYRSPVSSDTRKLFSDSALKALHKRVYKHSYDTRICYWCSALFRCRRRSQAQVFTCSAFVSFVLTELGVLSKKTAWTAISAAELSCTNTKYPQWQCQYTEDKQISDVANPMV